MIWYFLGFSLLGWSLIYPLTDFYVRFVNPTTIRKGAPGSGSATLYLTLDDGPDPETPPQILKILAELNIPACFFLVAAKAEQHPQLVTAIVNAGHEIGLHTLNHRHAYLMFAKASRASVADGKAVLERIATRPVFWFRPPWGAMNFFQYRAASRFCWPIVLWSANARDWKAQTGQAGILRRLAKKISNGAVVVLHDAGGENGAPRNTVGALPEFITACQAAGYRFCSLKNGGMSQDVGSRGFTAGQ